MGLRVMEGKDRRDGRQCARVGGGIRCRELGGRAVEQRITSSKAFFSVVGIEVSCYIEDHKRQGPRCSRTLRFKRHGGREMTEQKLKWWCIRGFNAQACPDCKKHQGEPYEPPSGLPTAEDRKHTHTHTHVQRTYICAW